MSVTEGEVLVCSQSHVGHVSPSLFRLFTQNYLPRLCTRGFPSHLGFWNKTTWWQHYTDKKRGWGWGLASTFQVPLIALLSSTLPMANLRPNVFLVWKVRIWLMSRSCSILVFTWDRGSVLNFEVDLHNLSFPVCTVWLQLSFSLLILRLLCVDVFA